MDTMRATIKRYALFLLTNIAIVIMISIVLGILESVFGISISSNGYGGLLVFAFIFGFAGAIVNLLISRWMAKKAYKIQLITGESVVSDRKLTAVYQTVQQIASNKGITMPEVGYYQSSTPNAFATGASRNKSLVAVSTGLLDNMDLNEIRAVVGHEMAHILNGDMVTMTLLQGVLNTFVIFFARVIAIALSTAGQDEDSAVGWLGYFLTVIILDIVLSLLASIILMAYSRHREYHADAGSANMVGKQHMIAALQKLGQLTKNMKTKDDAFATLKIAGGKTWMNLFRSHPTMDKRIEALRNMPLG